MKLGVRYKLLGLFFFFYKQDGSMAGFKTFIEYASEQRILTILIKERVKVALKSKLKNTQNNYRNFTEDFENLKISEQIAVLMPTRNWVRPQKKERFVDGVAKSSKQILTRSLALTIKRDKRKQGRQEFKK